MLTIWGFFCMGCLIVAAIKTVKNMLSPEKRRLRREAEKVQKETKELLGRN